MAKKNNAFGTFAALSIIVLVVGFLFVFTDNFNTDLKTFYLKLNEEQIVVNESDFTFKTDIILTAQFLKDETEVVYTIKPNLKLSEDFIFYVEGAPHSFAALADLTPGFEIIKGETGITVKKTTLKQVLTKIYEKEIALPATLPTKSLFRLTAKTVEPKPREVAVTFNFHTPVTGVDLIVEIEI